MQRTQLLLNGSLCLSEKARLAVYFLTLTTILLVINVTYADRTIMYDAANYYYTMTDLFTDHGHFALFNYNSPLRGYIFPLLLEVPLSFSKITGLNNLVVFRAFAAVFNSFALGLVFPLFFEKLFGFRARLWQSAIFVFLVQLFLHGHLALPMSDFPALAFMVFAMLIYLLLFPLRPDPQVETRPGWWKYLLIFLAGVALAVAVLTRPTNRFAFFLMVGLFLFRLVSARFPAAQKIGLAGLLAAGLAVILIPQALMNSIHYQKLTPFQLDRHLGQDLMMFQLYYGLKMQRLDIGSQYQGVKRTLIKHPEDLGEAVLAKHNITRLDELFTIRRYLKLIYKNPLDFAAIYARHLFDGLDIIYPSQFNYTLRAPQVRYRLLNYTLWFLAIWLVGRWRGRLLEVAQPIALLAVLSLSALVTIPGVIETRFFMPVFMILYAAVAFWLFSECSYWRELFSLKTFGLYAGFMAVCLAFSASIFAQSGLMMVW